MGKIIKSGISIISVILTIITITIILSIFLPPFLRLKVGVKILNEDQIIDEMKSIIKNRNIQNIASGIDPDQAWPKGQPLSFLENTPPFKYGVPPEHPNGITWTGNDEGNNNQYHLLYCPHYKAQLKGSLYIYQDGPGDSYGHQPGDFWVQENFGH
jgi:hypothetical protein